MATHYQGSEEEVRALDAFIKLSRAFSSLLSRIDQHKTIGDLNTSQFGTLEMLYHLGPLNQNTIGEKLLVSKSNMVAVIDKLENALWLGENAAKMIDAVIIFISQNKERL